MADVILLKLGGSLITEKDRPRTARGEVIRRLAGEIAAARARMDERLLVGHGSGSFGHVAAKRAGLGEGPMAPEALAGVAATRVEAAELHRIVCGALTGAGLAPFSFPPGSFLVACAAVLEGPLPEGLPLAIAASLLPVVYGDAVLDTCWGGSIASTEAVFAFLAARLPEAGYPVRRAIWLGETDGLLDAAGRTIPVVDPAKWEEAAAAVWEPVGTDVTGGMRLRLATTAALAQRGIPSLLTNGTVPGLLERALLGEAVPGTVVG